MKVTAPFKPEQVSSLNSFQRCPLFHPFTCACGSDLVAGEAGWHCPRCPYTRDWAYSGMADGSWERSVRGAMPGVTEAREG